MAFINSALSKRNRNNRAAVNTARMVGIIDLSGRTVSPSQDHSYMHTSFKKIQKNYLSFLYFDHRGRYLHQHIEGIVLGSGLDIGCKFVTSI